MAHYEFLWTAEIIEHLADHGVALEDFEQIVKHPGLRGASRTSGRPCCWGTARDGRWLICVYELLDDVTVLPVTAYAMPEPDEDAEA